MLKNNSKYFIKSLRQFIPYAKDIGDELTFSYKYQKKSRLPTFPDLECKRSFIRGLMDSDGWISKRRNGKYIKYEVGFKNSSLLSPSIYNLMLELGLSCNKLVFTEGIASYRNGKQYEKSRAQWSWTITPRNYITTVGFSIARKQLLCQEFLKDRSLKEK